MTDPKHETVRSVIYSAIDEINESRSPGRRISVSDDTVLFGPDGVLESVELVNLIVSTEMLLTERLQEDVALADDQELWEGGHALRTVGAFTDYVRSKLRREQPA